MSARAETHAFLRASTQPLHDALEARVGLPESAASLNDYRRVLGRFLGFHEPLEAVLAERDWGGFDYAARRRAGDAAGDLAALGLDEAAVAALPRRRANVPGSEAEALGMLYVLEGSTLGGQVIRRGLERSFGPEVLGATRFFDGRGAQTGPLWRAFLQQLEAGVRTPDQQAAARRAAESVFRDLLAWFG